MDARIVPSCRIVTYRARKQGVVAGRRQIVLRIGDRHHVALRLRPVVVRRAAPGIHRLHQLAEQVGAAQRGMTIVVDQLTASPGQR